MNRSHPHRRGAEQQECEHVSQTHEPLDASIVVPVFNGSEDIVRYGLECDELEKAGGGRAH